MKDNRSRLAKTYLTESEYDDLESDAIAAGDSVSDVLRKCWKKCRNGKPASRPVARPSPVPFRAKFAPGRMPRAPLNVRMNN